MTDKCFTCQNDTANRCAKCGRAWYCTKMCQIVDWKRHKKYCVGKYRIPDENDNRAAFLALCKSFTMDDITLGWLLGRQKPKKVPDYNKEIRFNLATHAIHVCTILSQFMPSADDQKPTEVNRHSAHPYLINMAVNLLRYIKSGKWVITSSELASDEFKSMPSKGPGPEIEEIDKMLEHYRSCIINHGLDCVSC
jgi:hypothetical protein